MKVLKKKRLDRLGAWPWLSIDKVRDLFKIRVEKIAFGLDPNAPDDSGVPTLSEFIMSIWLFLENKYAKFATIKSHLNKWILVYFSGVNDKPLDAYSRRDIIKFVEWVASERSNVTANRCRELLSAIFRRGVDLELIDRNPCQGVRKFREEDSRDRDLLDDELSRLIKVLTCRIDKGDKVAQLTLLALSTGKRLGEIISLPWTQVHLDDRYFKIPARKTKNRKWDRVELNSIAYELLTKMDADQSPGAVWVFPSSRSASGHMVSPKRAFKSILREAEIENFRFHDSRRVYASLLINAGVSIETVRIALNHLDVKTTQIYARLKRSTVAEASEKAAEKLKGALNA